MWIRMIFLPGMVGLASGLAVAGGMFALLIALGVIARFAGKTNTASWVLYYEDAAALGGISEICSVCISSVSRLELPELHYLGCFQEYLPVPGPWLSQRL